MPVRTTAKITASFVSYSSVRKSSPIRSLVVVQSDEQSIANVTITALQPVAPVPPVFVIGTIREHEFCIEFGSRLLPAAKINNGGFSRSSGHYTEKSDIYE